jgi:hypothetical protein
MYDDDGYTSQPTHIRVYREDTGDEYVWHLDGADNDGNYTVEVRTYETMQQALDSIPLFVADSTFDGVEWRWDVTRKTVLRPSRNN